MIIRITTQSGYTWEEEVDDFAEASKTIRAEHDDVESIDVVDELGHIV